MLQGKKGTMKVLAGQVAGRTHSASGRGFLRQPPVPKALRRYALCLFVAAIEPKMSKAMAVGSGTPTADSLEPSGRSII